jgi:dihydrofolate reductase
VKPVLTLIAAMDGNRLLANAHGIPWSLPRDVQHFRRYTSGKWLLLGRRTFEEMRGWFKPGHTALVLTSQCGLDPKGARGVDSVPHALALAEAAGQSELVVCGGAQTYAAALPYADKLVITEIAHSFQGGTRPVYFPAWSVEEWSREESLHHHPDAENEWTMTITTWIRNAT